MFGETEYDLNCQYTSVPMEEQLEALGRAIDAGKVCRRGAVFNFPFLMKMFRLHIYELLVLDQVHWP